MPSETPAPLDVRRWLREQGIDANSAEGRWLVALLSRGEPAVEAAPRQPAEQPAA
jgi:hypothetical protein